MRRCYALADPAGMDQRQSGVLGHMLLIPTMIFVAVIELVSRVSERRAI